MYAVRRLLDVCEGIIGVQGGKGEGAWREGLLVVRLAGDFPWLRLLDDSRLEAKKIFVASSGSEIIYQSPRQGPLPCADTAAASLISPHIFRKDKNLRSVPTL